MVFAGPRHLEPSSAILHRGGDKSRNRQAISDVHSIAHVHHAGRMVTPSGTTPSAPAALNHVSGTRGGIVGVYQTYNYETELKDCYAQWEKRLQFILKAST